MTADDAVAFSGLAAHSRMLGERAVSSRELTELYLARIERLDPQLNAFRTVFGDAALEQADDADRRLAAGEQGPLLGVPLALKDDQDVPGDITGHGTGAYDEPATRDSELVARLRAAGAVFLGKTNLPELAIVGFTESKTWGVTRNPWDPQRTPGGSSGGSAAALAAGLASIATASDGAGSIRIPAANCGLFGLKPQRGRAPFSPDGGHWRGMSAGGCLARAVLDTALFLDVVTVGGGEPGGPPPPDTPLAEAAQRSPGRLRIAISAKPVRAVAPPIVRDEVRSALADAEELLRSLGHEVRHEDPAYGLAGNNLVPRYLGGINDDVRSVPHPERLERRTRGFARLGSLYPEPLVARAVRMAAKDANRINRIFERADVLVTPTVGEPAVPVDRWEGQGALRTLLGMSRTYSFTPVWNHTGQPAAAVPMGLTADGLPLSVQLIGPPNREDLLLSLAAQIEAERPWSGQRPPIA